MRGATLLALVLILSGCLHEAPDADPGSAWSAGCHLVLPITGLEDCEAHAVTLSSMPAEPPGWYCSVRFVPGVAFFTAPTLDGLGLVVSMGAAGYQLDPDETTTAVLHIVGSMGEGFYAWEALPESHFVRLPEWYGDEVRWVLHIVGIDYSFDSVQGARPEAQPLWQAVDAPWDEDLDGLVLIHHVATANADYYLANNTWETADDPYTGEPVSGFTYRDFAARTDEFGISVTHVDHVAGAAGAPGNVVRPDIACNLGTLAAGGRDQAGLQPVRG